MHKDVCFLPKVSRPVTLFCLSWCAGLLFGTLFAAAAGLEYFALMRPIRNSRVSIVCLIAAQLLPFLSAAYAAHISKSWIVIAVCACKVFSFAFCGYLVWSCFGSAGWLIRLLFLFTDICMVPVLCWFSLRRISGRSISAKKDLFVCVGLAVLITSFDYTVISPFLAQVIDI